MKFRLNFVYIAKQKSLKILASKIGFKETLFPHQQLEVRDTGIRLMAIQTLLLLIKLRWKA